jgi:hypothetical protein
MMTIHTLLHMPVVQYYIFAVLVAFPVARSLRRAGFPMLWAALLIIPMVGFLCCAGVMALKPWPATQQRKDA